MNFNSRNMTDLGFNIQLLVLYIAIISRIDFMCVQGDIELPLVHQNYALSVLQRYSCAKHRGVCCQSS